MQTLIDDMKARRFRRPAILAAATVTTFALVLILARMAAAPSLELLFARLEPAAASRILTELEGRGVVHDLRGDSIYVDAAARDRLRLDLATEGLPGGDGAGYELLDTLSGFGTTSQMFDAALIRAREGELARTLLAGRGVEAARVHIAASGRSPFQRERQATASVTLTMRSGDVPPELAEAAQTLVAGAVAGLGASDVSVVDSRSGRVVSRDDTVSAGAERSERLEEMRAAIDRILSARVGPGRFVAEVSLETSTEEELMRERVLDPTTRVVISTDTEESSSNGSEGGGEGVTVASNLPDGDAAGGGDARQSSSADTRERINYEVSERERQITRGPGAVQRITVAVMVDGTREVAADGEEVWTPRSDDELATIGDLVQSAVGFREERGDVVTVRTSRFESPELIDTAMPSLPWISGAQAVRLATVLGVLLAAIGIMAFVIRPLLSRGDSGAAAGLPAPESDAAALPPPVPEDGQTDAVSALDIGSDDQLPSLSDLADLPALGFDGGDGGAIEGGDPVDRLRALIAERRDETVEVLKGWIEEDARPEEAR